LLWGQRDASKGGKHTVAGVRKWGRGRGRKLGSTKHQNHLKGTRTPENQFHRVGGSGTSCDKVFTKKQTGEV